MKEDEVSEVLPERLVLIVKWLAENKDLLTLTDVVRLKLDIKGSSVRGEITVLPDIKKPS